MDVPHFLSYHFLCAAMGLLVGAFALTSFRLDSALNVYFHHYGREAGRVLPPQGLCMCFRLPGLPPPHYFAWWDGGSPSHLLSSALKLSPQSLSLLFCLQQRNPFPDPSLFLLLSQEHVTVLRARLILVKETNELVNTRMGSSISLPMAPGSDLRFLFPSSFGNKDYMQRSTAVWLPSLTAVLHQCPGTSLPNMCPAALYKVVLPTGPRISCSFSLVCYPSLL